MATKWKDLKHKELPQERERQKQEALTEPAALERGGIDQPRTEPSYPTEQVSKWVANLNWVDQLPPE